MTSKFSHLKLSELKEELRTRNAKLSGRKIDLVERLEAYDRNQNFGQPDVSGPDYQMVLPDTLKYMDVNADSIFCRVSMETVVNYVQKFEKLFDIEHSKRFYNELFLLYFRFALSSSYYFVKSCCHAEQKGRVTYNVDIKFDTNGDVIESQCECAAGMGPTAHCKHVCTVLYASAMFAKTKQVKTEGTCTQQLQTFHQSKKFIGSPIKVDKLDMPGADEFTSIAFDPRPDNFQNQSWYQDYFRNTCFNFPSVSEMPIFHLFKPANNLAVAHDHDYLEITPEDQFLETISVTRISPEERQATEKRTLGQSLNPQWADERTKRLSSSAFGRICKAVKSDRTDNTKLALSFIHLTKFTAPSLEHGKKYEAMAVSKYMSSTGDVVRRCGIVVCEEYPFLSCSPDGIINCDRIIEVKCPYSARDKQISNVTVPYLKSLHASSFSLCRKHDYYYQVQGQLLCTGAKECVFVVYTITDMVFFTVNRDDEFIKEMVASLKMFFDKHFRPALLEKRFYKSFLGKS